MNVARPPVMGAGSPMRGRPSGDRPAGLRREDPGRIAAGLSRLASLVTSAMSWALVTGTRCACPGQIGQSVRRRALFYSERVGVPVSPAIRRS